jgi:hypothetical protein
MVHFMHMYAIVISKYICIALEWVCRYKQIFTWFNIPRIYGWFHLIRKAIEWKISKDISHILLRNNLSPAFKKQSTNKSISRHLYNLDNHIQRILLNDPELFGM